ncbi:hypothetical protein JXA34_03260 [Patescibacteria group bacterium]|nr:hypothetical protein [Patescibacteria group bacterium]
MKKKKRNILQVRRILISVVVGVGFFFLTKTRIVNAVVNAQNIDLDLYLLENDLEVHTEVNDEEFRQISYKYKGKIHEITDEKRTSADPDTEGEYITWMSLVDANWQVFLYHVTTEKTIQLTQFGNNVNPSVSGDYVVWEGQVADVWQIFLYDGIRTKQLTHGDMPSQNAGVDKGFVVYDTKEPDGEDWNVYLYDVEKEETIKLSQYLPGRNPSISGGAVTWTVVVDGKPLTYKYFTGSEDIFDAEINGQTFDEELYENFVSTLESTSSEAPTEPNAFFQEGTVQEDTAPVVDISNQGGESDDEPDLPETVTAEDIIEELFEAQESTESVEGM